MSTKEDYDIYHSIDPNLSDDDEEPVAIQTTHLYEVGKQTPSDKSSVTSEDQTTKVQASDTVTTTTKTTTLVVEETKRSTQAGTEQSTEFVTVTEQVDSSELQCWPSRVLVTGSGLTGGALGEVLLFHVDAMNGGGGELAALCTGPNGAAYCALTDLGNGTYALSVRPEETGDHVLQVMYGGEAVNGSPFTFPVTATSAVDDVTKVNGSRIQGWPSRVQVTGSGLTGGVLGQELVFRVDARNGGPGVLTAYCTGPTRPAFCRLMDHGDGTFTLNTRPEEIGHHVLQVKYQGELVSGSPFTFPVTASSKPDATRVKVSGPGVENGILSTFQSNFAVDTKGAGAGNLSIRMQGPKGAFRMEMSRMSHGDRKVFCHYNPVGSGVYVIRVRWSNVDVPGSPFQVRIFDNRHEMQRDQMRQN